MQYIAARSAKYIVAAVCYDPRCLIFFFNFWHTTRTWSAVHWSIYRVSESTPVQCVPTLDLIVMVPRTHWVVSANDFDAKLGCSITPVAEFIQGGRLDRKINFTCS